MTEEQTKTLLQKKMDTLSAKHLHEIYLAPLQRSSVAVDALAIAVPGLLLTARLLTKGLAIGPFVDVVAESLAAVLLMLAIIKGVYGWQDKIIEHSRLRDENISLGTQADALIRKGPAATSDSVDMFLLLLDRSEQADRKAFGTPKEALKQRGYREALKEIDPGSTETKCPYCKASPWSYKAGNCQVCGNTPVTQQGEQHGG